MKQISEAKLCFWCLGCNKLELDNFEGVMNCRGFAKGNDMKKYYKILKRGEKKWDANI